MSELLRRHLEDYLRLRRALGFKLAFPGHVLPSLIGYLEAAGAATVTAELAIAWAGLPRGVLPVTWAHRLGAARGFARYLKTIDPATEIPPAGIWPSVTPRPRPYIWAEADIRRLLAASRALRPPLRASTHEALFGLVAVTGMRLGEAIGLDKADADLDSGVLTIRDGKFGLSPPGARAPERHQRAAKVRGPPGPAMPQPGNNTVLRLHRRHAVAHQRRRPHLRPAHHRPGPAHPGLPPEDS
jgi:integrase